MMAKPMKTLELHYPMIQFLIIPICASWFHLTEISIERNNAFRYIKMLTFVSEKSKNLLKYYWRVISIMPELLMLNLLITS